MKKVLSVLLALCLLFGAVPLSASAAGEEFVITDGVLTAYNGPGGEVVVPSTATEVDMFAFAEKQEITRLTIPGTVKLISYSGPTPDTYEPGKVNVREVVLEEGVTTLGDLAFFGLTASFEKITIPASVTSIRWSAFFKRVDMEIHYGGTMAQWQALDLDLTGYDENLGGFYMLDYKDFYKYSTIHCADGVLQEERPEFQIDKNGWV